MTARGGLTVLLALLALLPQAALAHAIDADALTAGLLDALIAAAIGVPAWLYLRGRRAGPPAWRDAAYGAGLIALVLALFGPLEALASQSFAAHMAQHMVLVALAPPLIVLARPGPAVLRGLPRRLRGVARWPRLPALAPLLALTRSPRATAVLHGLMIWLWHVPAAFELALRNDWLHAAEHVTLLASGLLFWRAVRGARGNAQGVALMWLLLTLMHTGLLGALLALS
nr:cytochrome c oxidase assembly protein [Burkholderiaceae bacterium]